MEYRLEIFQSNILTLTGHKSRLDSIRIMSEALTTLDSTADANPKALGGQREHRSAETGVLVKTLRDELGISQQKLAELLRISVRTVARWESGTEPDADFRRRMNKLRRWVDDRLREDGDPESVVNWLLTPKAQVLECTCAPVDLLTIPSVQVPPV
jgi:DNA-binding transcriptional regulator YiaG